jgi:hypothetical protein
LPDFLRKAVLDHRVLVGMNRDMVVYSKGQPVRKVREQEPGGKQFEIWVYGESPQPVEFVRFEGSFVTRVQLAKVGEPMEVRTENEMGDYWGNQPVVAANQHQVKLGDATDADRSEENAPRSAPTLRKPGEQPPPSNNDKNNPTPVMAPVNFPKDQQRPGDPGYTPTVSAQQPAQGSGSGQQSSAQQPAAGTPASGASSGQPQPSSGSGQSSQSQSSSGSGSTSGTNSNSQSGTSQTQSTNPPPNQR